MKKTSKALLSTVAALTVTLSSVGMPLASIPLIPTQSMNAYAAVQNSYYSVSVTNGKLSNGQTSGNAKVSQFITVKADEAPEGKQFGYWVDNKTELIVSYDSTYSFYKKSSYRIKGIAAPDQSMVVFDLASAFRVQEGHIVG